MRALVLDDDVSLRETLGDVLVTLGFDGVVLLDRFEQLSADESDVLSTGLAILDINLGDPKTSGIDAANWLVSKHYAGLIVFLTGHAASHPLVKRAQEQGNEQDGERIRIYEKPIVFNLLVELVKEARNGARK